MSEGTLADTSDTVGEPLDDGLLYDPMKATPAEPVVIPGQDGVLPEENKEDAPTPEPAEPETAVPEPEAVVPPVVEEPPAGDPTPPAAEPEPNAEVDLYAWDKDRQNADQEHANERKAGEAREAALQAQVNALTSARQNPEDGTAPQESAAEAKTLSQFEEAASQLSADSEAEDYTDVLKLVPDALKAAMKTGATDAVKALEGKVTELQSQITTTAEQRQAEQVQQAQESVNRQHNDVLKGLDKDHGGHLRNLANQAVSERLAAEGYDRDNRADVLTLKLLYTSEYERLAKLHPRKDPPPKPKGSTPRGAPGTGGAAVPTIKTGSRAEVAKQMLADGAFKP